MKNTENTTTTLSFRVWGADGHRQRESFYPSITEDMTGEYGHGICLVEEINSDKTGTNDYSIVRITCSAPEECEEEFLGQLSDGIFENCRCGKIEVLTSGDWKNGCWDTYGDGTLHAFPYMLPARKEKNHED